MKKKEKYFWVLICKHGTFGFFPNINIHKNTELFKNIILQYTLLYNIIRNILFLVDTYFK